MGNSISVKTVGVFSLNPPYDGMYANDSNQKLPALPSF
jgi:hypothetical protein